MEYEEIPTYTGNDSAYALRFPRFLSVRDNLALTDADTVDRVAELYDSQ